ncbi:ABC transporter substrate-binding protein [uncultured Cellulomonas sp.]|uniref:ABC transporter substrate-binding protein n=1 Tax=uncultured Cellulomonas sp. TaxID=189682 RepID=UPI0028E713BA|nr:ABC transporter substrate-binding protein [uncultured Cellulomonas sp.]
MRIRKLSTVVATAATLALLATACSGGSGTSDDPTGADGVSDKILTIGMPNGPQQPNQNPLANGSASLSLGYAFAVYESLMQVNELKPTDPPTPWLATSVEWNADSTQAVITARDGVKWSDGTDFTAEDIAFSIQLRKDTKELNTDFPDQYGDITVDGNKVTVNFLTGQYVNQVKLLKLLIVPKHLWEGQDAVTWTDDEMIGTGPFTLKSFTPQAVTLEPNTDYWGETPKVGTLRYDTFNDNAGLTTALTTGEAQWGWTFIPDFENTFIAKDPDHFHQVAGGGFGVDVLYLNNETKPFNDVAFRQALNMVVDRADISTTAGYGVWPQIKSVTGLPQPSGDAFISDAYADQELSVDVDGAKAVLTEAGYTWDGAGALVDPDGEKVAFTLQNPTGWTDYLDALGIISEGAKALGVEAPVEGVVQDTWFNDIIPFGNFQASLHWTDGGSTPWNMYSNIMDGASYVPLGESATWNFGRYKNDDVTKALADFKAGTSDNDRAAALDVVQKHFVEDVPGLVIWSRPAVAQYSTVNYTGFPTAEDPYANPQPTGPQAALILSKLTPTE